MEKGSMLSISLSHRRRSLTRWKETRNKRRHLNSYRQQEEDLKNKEEELYWINWQVSSETYKNVIDKLKISSLLSQIYREHSKSLVEFSWLSKTNFSKKCINSTQANNITSLLRHQEVREEAPNSQRKNSLDFLKKENITNLSSQR